MGGIAYVYDWQERSYDPPECHPGQQAYTFLIRILSKSFISVSIFSVCCYSRVSISMEPAKCLYCVYCVWCTLFPPVAEICARITGQPLSKVVPCPNKGSRWWFLNFPQLRDISYLNIFNVHNPGIACTDSCFSLNTAHLWDLIFCWKFVLICIVLSYLSLDTAHHKHLYTVVYGPHSGWCWWERS